MDAQIITIGDELLIGQTLDTNSHWLAQKLTALGFTVTRKISISDTKEAITDALNGTDSSDLSIFTGGLGPTNDDITKKVFAAYFNTPLVESSEVLSMVEQFITTRGSVMNKRNIKQAMVPHDAKILKNSQGTAPGLWFENKGSVIISLPGVPWEMKGILNEYGFDKLSAHFKLPNNYYKTVLVTEMAEAHLAEKLSSWECNLPKNISLAYLPSPGIVKLRLGAKGQNLREMQDSIENEIGKLKLIIGKNIFGYDKETLQEVVAKELNINNKTLSVAESCTGGSMAGLLTSIPGSSSWFTGGVVAYSNEVKSNLLKVNKEIIDKYGAVSEEVVKAMAIGACEQLNTDYSIATSGIAGPTGGTKDKPVGTVWIAVADKNTVVAKRFQFGSERNINIKRSSLAGLNMLRKLLSNNS